MLKGHRVTEVYPSILSLTSLLLFDLLVSLYICTLPLSSHLLPLLKSQ